MPAALAVDASDVMGVHQILWRHDSLSPAVQFFPRMKMDTL